MSEVTTDKIKRVADEQAQRAVELHVERCPSRHAVARIETVVDDLKEAFNSHREKVEENTKGAADAFRRGEVQMERLKGRDTEHDLKLETVDARLDKCEAFDDEIRTFFQRAAMRVIIAVVLAVAAATGVGQGIQLIIQSLGG